MTGFMKFWGVEVFRVFEREVNSRDPSIEIMPTLGPKVCKYHLH